MNSRKSFRSPAKRAALLAVLLAPLLPQAAAAQRYPVRTFSERDGLASTTVHDLAQDPQGRMWFLTRAGVVRYDGFEWVAPDPRPAYLVLSYSLLELDPAGGAWLAAEDPSLPLLRVGAPPGEASELETPAPGPAVAERRSAFAAVAEADGT
ncbi:MAG TPA: two-component regulator propeller domain-containing protein, partial [Thermoanaerobaculia bacterium]|nr:two-component regulator propeller domain-containing protein [Thermoanaerobaculia bacterium]